MADSSWALFDRNGTMVFIEMTNALTGEREILDFYASYEVAHKAVHDLMEPEDIERLGIHIRELIHSSTIH